MASSGDVLDILLLAGAAGKTESTSSTTAVEKVLSNDCRKADLLPAPLPPCRDWCCFTMRQREFSKITVTMVRRAYHVAPRTNHPLLPNMAGQLIRQCCRVAECRLPAAPLVRYGWTTRPGAAADMTALTWSGLVAPAGRPQPLPFPRRAAVMTRQAAYQYEKTTSPFADRRDEGNEMKNLPAVVSPRSRRAVGGL